MWISLLTIFLFSLKCCSLLLLNMHKPFLAFSYILTWLPSRVRRTVLHPYLYLSWHLAQGTICSKHSLHSCGNKYVQTRNMNKNMTKDFYKSVSGFQSSSLLVFKTICHSILQIPNDIVFFHKGGQRYWNLVNQILKTNRWCRKTYVFFLISTLNNR